MSFLINLLKNYLELIAKIILGSGLIAVSIKELAEARRKQKLKARIEEELASEFFLNEYAGKIIERQSEALSIRTNIFSRKYQFSLSVIKSILSSGYFLFLDADLVHLLVEYSNRLENFNRELQLFYDLPGDQQKFRASGIRTEAWQLLRDLENSKKLNNLRTRYFENWKIRSLKRIEEIYRPDGTF
jgi:hypothetical protein